MKFHHVLQLTAAIIFSNLLQTANAEALFVADSTKINNNASTNDEDDSFWDDYKIKKDITRKPTMDLYYSSFNSSLKDIPENKIAGIGCFEARIGVANIYRKKQNKQIIYENNNFIFFGGGSSSFSMLNNSDSIKSTYWRFGFGERTQRGWNFGRSGLILYYGSALAWTNFSAKDTSFLTEYTKINDFHDAFRFGKFYEGGASFIFDNSVAISVGYEQTAVFPRTLPFYWLTSDLIEYIAHGLLEGFVRKVGESSPSSAPVVGFVLHNAVGFGTCLLKKQKMNWPFDTAPALVQTGFRVGTSFRF